MNEDSTDADTGFFTFDQLADENVNDTLSNRIEGKYPSFTPVYVYTAIFGLIFIIAPLLVRRGPNMNIIRVSIMISTVCCWIFWTTTYIVQINPLLGPRLSNHSLAWIGHKWGHDAAELTKKFPAPKENDTAF